jgi:acyl dehydratase
MADESSILEQHRSEIGKESPPRSEEVEKGAIRRFVNALGDHNPLYEDEEIAKKGRYGGIIAPPLFVLTFGRQRRPQPDTRLGRAMINAGTEYEFFQPIRPGDVITHTSKLVDVKERTGRLGRMFISVTETTYVNQMGEMVAIARGTRITHEGHSMEGKND